MPQRSKFTRPCLAIVSRQTKDKSGGHSILGTSLPGTKVGSQPRSPLPSSSPTRLDCHSVRTPCLLLSGRSNKTSRPLHPISVESRFLSSPRGASVNVLIRSWLGGGV